MNILSNITQAAPEVDWSLELSAVFPAGASVLLLLLSPLLTSKVTVVLNGQITRDLQRTGIPHNTPVPPPLAQDVVVKDYLEYAVDAAQIIPATILPVLGALFAVSSGLTTAPMLIAFTLALLTALALDAWILSTSASDYKSRKRFGYTLSTAAAIASNCVGIALILFFG